MEKMAKGRTTIARLSKQTSGSRATQSAGAGVGPGDDEVQVLK